MLSELVLQLYTGALDSQTLHELTSSSSPLVLPEQPLLMSDHGLQPLSTRALHYTREEYRIYIQVDQP